MQLGAVEADGAEPEQLHFACQLQHLQKDTGQLVEKAPTQAGQRGMSEADQGLIRVSDERLGI